MNQILFDVVNGIWVNYSINQTGLGGVINTVSTNFSWFWVFMLVVIYISLLLFFTMRQGMQKFIYTAFIGMIITIAFRFYGLVDTNTVDMAIILFGFLFIVEWLTGR